RDRARQRPQRRPQAAAVHRGGPRRQRRPRARAGGCRPASAPPLASRRRPTPHPSGGRAPRPQGRRMGPSGAPPAAAGGTITIGGDLTVNRLGFGAMRITGRGVWGAPPDLDEARAVLRRAVERGTDFIDTADSYGPEVSENLIAEALHPYPDGLVIATKGGLERPGPGRGPANGPPDHPTEACEGSLRRLRLEQIPLYQFHRPDPRVPFGESIGALIELQREGKVRHIGLSNVTVQQLREAQRITPIASVQNRYNHAD